MYNKMCGKPTGLTEMHVLCVVVKLLAMVIHVHTVIIMQLHIK